METFSTVAERFLLSCEKTHQPRTLVSYQKTMRHFFRLVPGAKTEALARHHLRSFVDTRMKEVSAASVNLELTILKACCSWGEVEELIVAPPSFAKLRLPPGIRAEALTKEQVDRVLKASRRMPGEKLVRLAHGAGLRRGEILMLRWSDVEQSGVIHIRPRDGWKPKTEAAVRSVPCPGLASWLQEWAKSPHFQTGYVVGVVGEALGHEMVRNVFDKARVQHNRPLHALRHNYATELAEAGVPVHVAQKLLGHSSPTVTLGIYTHARKDALVEAGAALDAYRQKA